MSDGQDAAARAYQARRARQRASFWFRRFYPDYISEDQVFDQMLAAQIGAGALIVDAGCGSGEISRPDYTRARAVIGIDRDAELAANTQVTWRAQSDLESIPLAAECADVVVCKYVIEHLASPPAVFREFARVLRPGGCVVAHTPNTRHYVQFAARLIPQQFHFGLVRALCGRASFPKYRRANTPPRLIQAMQAAGLECERMTYFESAPDYFQNVPLLYPLGVAYERWVNASPRRAEWRLNLIGVFRKPAR
jgi:2-polyprenyl-3-methyl-5-hydroxy-6-metoxy-1,4-benzoquinol methylase